MQQNVLMEMMTLIVKMMVVSVMVILAQGRASLPIRQRSGVLVSAGSGVIWSWERTFFAERVAVCLHLHPFTTAARQIRSQR